MVSPFLFFQKPPRLIIDISISTWEQVQTALYFSIGTGTIGSIVKVVSSVTNCCRPPCPTVPPVNIPGSAGASAYTFSTEAFVIPDVNAQVVVQVLNTSGLTGGENVVLTGPANFRVFAVNGPTTVTLTFLGYAGDLGVGTIVASGASVIPAGQEGPAGLAGQNGYGTTTSAFTIPSIGNTVVVPVVSSAMFVQGQYVVTPGPANFLVYAIPNSTSVTLQFLGNPTDAAPGVNVAAGSNISPAGEAGGNAYSTLTAQITIPTVGNTVTANVNSTAWMTVGAVVIMPGPVHFSVTTLISSTQVVLTALGYINDISNPSTVANGSVVAPSGTQPFGSTALTSYGSGTPYVLTAVDSQMVFGTSSPQITLPTAGTWLITALVQVSGNAPGTVAGTMNLHLQRTNNTAGNVPNSNAILNFNGAASNVYIDQVVPLKIGVYPTVSAGDTLQLWGFQTNSSGTTFYSIITASLSAYRIS